jgi:hypothetical protein
MFPSDRRIASDAKKLAQTMGQRTTRLYVALSRIEDGDAHDLEWAGELLDAIKDQARVLGDKLRELGGGPD